MISVKSSRAIEKREKNQDKHALYLFFLIWVGYHFLKSHVVFLCNSHFVHQMRTLNTCTSSLLEYLHPQTYLVDSRSQPLTSVVGELSDFALQSLKQLFICFRKQNKYNWFSMLISFRDQNSRDDHMFLLMLWKSQKVHNSYGSWCADLIKNVLSWQIFIG